MKINRLFKMFSVSLLSLMMLATVVVPAMAEETVVITEDNIQDVDEYVLVIDNQFELRLPENVKIEESLRQTIESRIDVTNKDISENNGIIDLIDKRITYSGTRVKRSWSYQIDKFWWGVRHVLRTESAKNNLIDQFDAGSKALSVTAIIGGVVFGGVGGPIAGLGVLWLSSMRDSLIKYKNIAPMIELTITWVGMYNISYWIN